MKHLVTLINTTDDYLKSSKFEGGGILEEAIFEPSLRVEGGSIRAPVVVHSTH